MGVAAVAIEHMPLFFEVLEHVGFQIGPCCHVHDFENGRERVVMVGRALPLYQLAQAAEQVLQPQIGAYTLVEGILVKNHSAIFVGFKEDIFRTS